MRRILLALTASLATLAIALPAAAEEAAPKAEEKAPEKTEVAPPPVAEKPTPKSIEANNNEFLGKGSLIIGAERVFGFAMSSEKPEGSDAIKHTQWGVLWAAPTSVYQIPRMAIDYVAFDQVTFGGSLGIAHTSTTVPATGVTPEISSSATNLLVAPRAGYIFGGKGVLSLWARGGFSFWSIAQGNDQGSKWGVAFNLEPEVIISPYKHLGIYVGAVLDLGLFGKASPGGGGESASYNVTNYGATSGLRAWF